MLRRVLLIPALCALLSCQTYDFTPVAHCVLQPGATRVTLAGTSTADVLFVVDDSGSMAAEQGNLANNFGAFIAFLAQAQQQRAAARLEPFEFHVAVTTSSIFEAWQPPQPAACSGSPLACVVPDHYAQATTSTACSDAGAACDDLIRDFYFQTTNPVQSTTFCPAADVGVGVSGAPFPAGDFVAPSPAAGKRVIHFTKQLNWAQGAADPSIAALVRQFQQNVHVGTCGSGMEQHLEAGRLAIKKALRQDGLRQPADVDPSEWPHPNAKLVVVWVGDEDDCSNPDDPTKSLSFTPDTSGPGNDVCTAEQGKPLADQRLFPLTNFDGNHPGDYADFLAGLGRKLGAAFIYSAKLGADGHCLPDGAGGCTPGTCGCQCPVSCAGGCAGVTDPGSPCFLPPDCSGKIGLADSRFHELSTALRAKGADTFEASVCDADWSKTLQGIAALVTPPRDLQLPTRPAAAQIAALRIESADGSSSRLCKGPAQDADWWFTDCSGNFQAAPSTCIQIRHPAPAGGCGEANPGETYVAEYLGIIPEGGCTKPAGEADSESQFCSTALGGPKSAWQCIGATAGVATSRGTCACHGSP